MLRAILSILAFATLPLVAGEPPPNPNELVASMQKFCGGLNTLACEIDLLRVAKSPGKTSERRAHFECAFQRPNLLSVLLKDEGSTNYAWICDGKDVFTYIAGIEKYSKSAAPAALSDLFASPEIYVIRNTLEGALLLDELLVPGATKLPANATAVSYVAAEEIGGEKTQHLRFMRPEHNWDVWILDGPTPLPMKVTGHASSFSEPNAKIEFTVEFKRWLPGATFDPRAFQFDAGSKAKRVSGFLAPIPPHALLNTPAPAAALQMANGKARVMLDNHIGRDVVVLDFWAISCVPCIGIMPKVDAVAKKFSGKNVVFYAMNENDSPEDVREFLKLKGISLTPTIHNKAENFAKFKVDAIPMTFVIDKAGIIRAVHTVHSDDLSGELTTLIESLLKQ